MKKNIHSRFLLMVLLLIFNITVTKAQCPGGYTRDTLQWDYLDFIPNTGSYISPTAYVTLAQSQTQRFTFGTQKLTITHNYSGSNDPGDNTTHTGETSSYGNGADVQFIGNGAITVTFQNAVQNVKFSLYDVDRGQRVVVSSTASVTMSTLAGTILTLSSNPSLSARADAPSGTVVANNANTPASNGTINVDIAGPVTTFTITVTNTGTCSSGGCSEDGSFWLSDVSACTTGSFTNNYYNISKPFTGPVANQAAYILVVRNDSIYYTNIANGRSKFLFADLGNPYINSLAYDPYRHMVYYTYSLSGPGGTINANDRTLRRYDYDMDTIGVVANDVRTMGIPLYDQGVESGSAGFYDGDLYLGVEGGNGVTDRESTVWRVDFTAAYVPTGLASQVFAVPSDKSDWGDIGMNNGMLYDFDGSGSGTDFYHLNMATGSGVRYAPSPSTLVPRQVGVDWNGNIYNVGSPSTVAAGTFAPYNYNGSVGASTNISFMGANPTGSWGDAAEAFKPKTDYGDAPASYDPAGSDPATTEEDDSLRLGNSVGIEWVKKTSSDATGDGPEEDGLTGTQVISSGVSSYLLSVKVYNHTGANATLIGWVDANGNGTFQTGEASTVVTVPSAVGVQTVALNWPSINVTLLPLATTFMRLRLTSSVNGMTAAHPTGFFENGEVEDYRVSVVIVLPDQKVELKAQKTGINKVALVWNVNDENGISKYELQRSNDGISWQTINDRNASGNVVAGNYTFADNDPAIPVSYFRVKVFMNSGASFYSDIKAIDFSQGNSISVSPNPTNSISKLNIQSGNAGTAKISVLDFTGRMMSDDKVKIVKGSNTFVLNIVSGLSSGVYKVRVQLEDEILVTTLIVVK